MQGVQPKFTRQSVARLWLRTQSIAIGYRRIAPVWLCEPISGESGLPKSLLM